MLEYLKDDNYAIRRLLWLNHGCTTGLYGDDGEMQCNCSKKHRPIDFKRDSAAIIDNKLTEYARRRYGL